MKRSRTGNKRSSLNLASDEDSEASDGHVTSVAMPGTSREQLVEKGGRNADTTITERPSSGPSDNQTSTAHLSEDNTMFPKDLYQFDWKPFDDTTNSPSRREKFPENIKVGATSQYETPYEVFVSIWDQEIMGLIVKETNEYAMKVALIMSGGTSLGNRFKNWNTNIDEVYVYLSIVLAMEVVVKSRIDEYWSDETDIFQTPGFRIAMSLKRFLWLNRHLQFKDNTLKISSNTDQPSLVKISPIIEHFNRKFSELYTIGQSVILDQSHISCYGNSKPSIKLYEISETDTGYTWKIEVCNISSSFQSSILRLTEDLKSRGHTLWMDSSYNTPALVRALKASNIDCVGTIRMDCLQAPEKSYLKEDNVNRTQVTGCTSGDVDILVWRDKDKAIKAFVSTYHGRDVIRKRNGAIKPVLVRDSNLCMKNLENKKQFLATYSTDRFPGKIWYKVLLNRILNVSVLNTFILYSHGFATRGYANRFNWFMQDLIRVILRRHGKIQDNSIPIKSKRELPKEVLIHFPEMYVLSEGTEPIQRTCAHCDKLCSSYCPGCNVPLCTYTCFRPYHTDLHTLLDDLMLQNVI